MSKFRFKIQGYQTDAVNEITKLQLVSRMNIKQIYYNYSQQTKAEVI